MTESQLFPDNILLIINRFIFFIWSDLYCTYLHDLSSSNCVDIFHCQFEGEIQVLYDVTIDPTLDSKKWGNKDLQLKPGEVIDVIVKATDDKLIVRNRDGKCKLASVVMDELFTIKYE